MNWCPRCLRASGGSYCDRCGWKMTSLPEHPYGVRVRCATCGIARKRFSRHCYACGHGPKEIVRGKVFPWWKAPMLWLRWKTDLAFDWELSEFYGRQVKS